MIQTLKPNQKILVFGLGYDSYMWYLLAQSRCCTIYFVEDLPEYIEMNPQIPTSLIIPISYNKTTVKDSLQLFTEPEERQIRKRYERVVGCPPPEIACLGLFDVILVDGPRGNTDSAPGRFIPIYWAATKVAAPNAIIYIDDAERLLESNLIQLYFANKPSLILDSGEGSGVDRRHRRYTKCCRVSMGSVRPPSSSMVHLRRSPAIHKPAKVGQRRQTTENLHSNIAN